MFEFDYFIHFECSISIEFFRSLEELNEIDSWWAKIIKYKSMDEKK